MKIAINAQFGGFGLSEKAYERLIELGIPVQKYHKQERDPETGLYENQKLNDGEIIFDRLLTPENERDKMHNSMMRLSGRYWDDWIGRNRNHPLLIQIIEELGVEANGSYSTLKIVEIPDGVEWQIEEYDGNEWVSEKHRTWD